MYGLLWTKEEDAILREYWGAGTTRQQICELLPGRSYEAAKIHARKLGLKRKGFAWSPQEDAIVREIWKMEGSLKSHLHRLPGRSWMAVVRRGEDMGLPNRDPKLFASRYSWVDEVVNAELAKGIPLTAHQIAERTEASYTRAIQVLRRGRGSKYRVVEWVRLNPNGTGSWSPIWAVGDGEDAPRPEKKPRIIQCREYRARKKIAAGKINPFASLMGSVMAPLATQGRVFKQDMTIHADELEAA